MIPSWVARYIGIPFVSRGRDFSGCDCYGLVRLVEEREFGHVLPALSDAYADALDHAAVEGIVRAELPLLAGQRLDGPELGAVAVVRICLYGAHLGVYVGDGMILHSRDQKTGSVLERESSVFFQGRLEGYYRVL